MRIRRAAAMLCILSCVPLSYVAAGHTVSMAVAMDPATFDPHGAMHPGAPVLYSYIYDTLIYQDGDGRLVPNLAESWTVSPDGLTVTFMLRRGVRFSNGRPFDSESVRYTVERLQRIGRRSYILTEIQNVARVRVMDAHRVALDLHEPSAPLLSALSYAYAAMLDPVAVESGGAEYGESPVGTGPYVVEEWISGSRLTLVPNPFYDAHRPTDDPALRSTVGRMHIFFTPHEATREQALLSGELDMAYFTSRAAALRVADRPGFSLMSDAVRGLVYLGFNVESALFSDLRMRRAVA
ncbi:MAG: ABC transporter substrate-binding protein, partial [Spirochaetales bacterium]|nr:ABC transporter substrate-binding protein [Spirochaetales bacterium]